VAVNVAVSVIAPVAVAALGNDTVDLIDTVIAADSRCGLSRIAPSCSPVIARGSTTASATPTISFPFTSAITITIVDHDHDHDHARGTS